MFLLVTNALNNKLTAIMTSDHDLTIICATNWINNRAMKLRQTTIFIESIKVVCLCENFFVFFLLPHVVGTFVRHSFNKANKHKIIRHFGDRQKISWKMREREKYRKTFYWCEKKTRGKKVSKNKALKNIIKWDICECFVEICSKLFNDFLKKLHLDICQFHLLLFQLRTCWQNLSMHPGFFINFTHKKDEKN